LDQKYQKNANFDMDIGCYYSIKNKNKNPSYITYPMKNDVMHIIHSSALSCLGWA